MAKTVIIDGKEYVEKKSTRASGNSNTRQTSSRQKSTKASSSTRTSAGTKGTKSTTKGRSSK